MATKLVATKIDPGRSPDYGREISGRCRKCGSRFMWPRKLGKLSEMLCPFCNCRLGSTTHLFKGATYCLEDPNNGNSGNRTTV